MNTKAFNDLHINEIREEYRRIDSAWLLLHYKISIGLAVFAFLVECFMAFVIIHSDMFTTTVDRYIWKFIVAPSGVNFLCVAVGTFVIRSKRFSQNQKIYTASFLFLFICFILFAVHHSFGATYYLFAIAIVLTTVYVNYRVTCITALVSIAAVVITELFVQWDADKISIFESMLRLGNFLIALFILAACFLTCLIEISYERQKNEASIQKEMERQMLARRLQTDELTGVFSRKALHDAMRDMEMGETGGHYIFAIADIDHFKGINDYFGHYAGDLCLMEFAKILKENSGKSSVFRYGGDEFCLLFHNADMEEAVLTCERIQKKLKGICLEDYPLLEITASFGLEAYSGQLNAARLFINADQALYEAKKQRDSICVF